MNFDNINPDNVSQMPQGKYFSAMQAQIHLKKYKDARIISLLFYDKKIITYILKSCLLLGAFRVRLNQLSK